MPACGILLDGRTVANGTRISRCYQPGAQDHFSLRSTAARRSGQILLVAG